MHDKFVILEPQEEEEAEDEEEEEEEEEEEVEESENGKEDADTEEKPSKDASRYVSGSSLDSSSDTIGSDTEATSIDSDADLDFKYPNLDLPTRLANKKAHPVFKSLLRSKGFIWLATRPYISGDWSQAGAMLTVSGGMNWFAAIPEDEWPSTNQEIHDMIKKDFTGEWGDRRQEIVFIGEGINVKAITQLFDDCLLNDQEMRTFVRIMRRDLSNEGKEKLLFNAFDDGWEDWVNPLHMEDGHSH